MFATLSVPAHPHTVDVPEHEVPARRTRQIAVSRAGDPSERRAQAATGALPLTEQRPADVPDDRDIWAVVRPVLASPGEPLPPAVRSAAGHDFARVRVHTDELAASSARALDAAAYTVGDHIAFDAGQYRPATRLGRALLAHELAHVEEDGPLAVRRSGKLGFFGDIFTEGPFESLSRMFGEGTFTPQELLAYLGKLRRTGKAEGDYDSDNKARALVRLWVQGDRRFQLDPQLKKLLVRDMYKGTTSEGDATAILDILERSLEPDLHEIFSADGVRPKQLHDSFNPPERNRLIALLNLRVKGGYQAAFEGRLTYLGGVSAAPHLNDEIFRRRWETALVDVVSTLQAAKVAGACAFPGPRGDRFDTEHFEQRQTNIDMLRGHDRLVPKSSSPYNAVALLRAHLDRWTCECLFFTQLAQLFAWHKVLPREAFDAKFANFTTGAGRGAPTTGLESEQVAESAENLTAAPVGTVAVWHNSSAYAKGTGFEYEHAIKTVRGGPDRPDLFAAHPFSPPDLTAEQVMTNLAAENADYPAHHELTAAMLPQLAADGVAPSVITMLRSIVGIDKVSWKEYRELPPIKNLTDLGNPEALEQQRMIRDRVKGVADPGVGEAYVKDKISLWKIEIPK